MSDIAASPVQTPLEVEESGPAAPPAAPQPRAERTRRKLDLTQNKRGAFSVLMGTLNRAKKEDKERNASEAAQKRVLLEKRLHAKLARQTMSADRATQSKRERAAATKKEEELALKENLVSTFSVHILKNLFTFVLFYSSQKRSNEIDEIQTAADSEPSTILAHVGSHRHRYTVAHEPRDPYRLPTTSKSWSFE
ncbi:hypothetical protein FS842_006380 [Serendipita sp. 407]|nr:hypothetical protein FS842_006380 [Serendipita sp. 407]